MARNDLETLQHLTTILVDAADLYEEAAELAHPDFARELEALAADRRELIGRFRAFGMNQGKNIHDQGSMAGAVNEALMQVRALAQDDTKAAITQVEKGEEYIRDEIQNALAGDELTISTRMFLADVRDEVEMDHDRMSSLKNSFDHELTAVVP